MGPYRAHAWQAMSKTRLLTILCVLVLAPGVAFLPVSDCLEICASPGRTVFLPAERGTRFMVGFVHSVEKTPVTEEFTIYPDGRICLRAASFRSLGAGLPFSRADGFAVENGCFRIEGLERSLPDLVLWVSELTRHCLDCGERRVDLVSLTPGGGKVRVRARRFPRIVAWFLLKR